jgi:hypothetical protein
MFLFDPGLIAGPVMIVLAWLAFRPRAHPTEAADKAASAEDDAGPVVHQDAESAGGGA